ncbi:hypothetical protein B0A48_16529 [Cryoendolithus antarcticus]|uniref:Potassium channel tetramerisation-type BTB domain-containing protein n=1 Tax=Cryoendolithus antarcticus TaxID=1507870 RepID=A0A1V8SEU8_9PEZI|nr:hypothetical protein B0A48_16529 [Cryoendolithus antarcticus]
MAPNLPAEKASSLRHHVTDTPTDLLVSQDAISQGSIHSDGAAAQSSTGGQNSLESATWNWKSPSIASAAPSTYIYEPQGELLTSSNQPAGSVREFHGPDVLPIISATKRKASGNLLERALSSSSVLTVPTSVSSASGTKRKVNADSSLTAVDSRTDLKRSHTVPEGSELTKTSHMGSTSPRAARARPSAPSREPSYEIPGSNADRALPDATTPIFLPTRKVFPIQIGDRLFRLSGASISSDAPSYFSQFFEEQLRQSDSADSVRTLYIDRDPSTFEDISLHLQGYHVSPRDGPHFVRLFADAQFYSLPRLSAQLFASTIYVRVGEAEFQIPKDLFNSPGNTPNYFSLGFSSFFTTPSSVFPGLTQRTLLRPPSLLPPSVMGRSARTFADLLQVLKGYPLQIRCKEHREELLRDARYFHLKGLEQRLVPCDISHNLARGKSEILIRLEDVRQSGISFLSDAVAAPSEPSDASPASTVSLAPAIGGAGWIYYQRPYIDAEAHALIVEISGDESTELAVAALTHNAPVRYGRAVFSGLTLARITSLFGVVANKMNLPITQPLGLMLMDTGKGISSLGVSPRNTGISDERVKVRLGTDVDVMLDGKEWRVKEEEKNADMDADEDEASRRREASGEEEEADEWIVKKAQWRLRVQPIPGGSGMEVILGAVKIEAYSSEKARNAARGFLW